MKCAYCNNEISGTESVQFEGMNFCNPIHRYSYKMEQSQKSTAANVRPEAATSSLFGGQLGTIIGSGVGLAIGLYAGIHVIVPFSLLFGVLWILGKTNTVPPAGRGIIAVLTAQFGWMFLGAALTGEWNVVWFDLLFLGGGVLWLLFSVNAVPVIILLMFELGVLVINGNVFLQLSLGSAEHRAMTVHLVLRFIALAVLVNGLVVLRNGRRS